MGGGGVCVRLVVLTGTWPRTSLVEQQRTQDGEGRQTGGGAACKCLVCLQQMSARHPVESRHCGTALFSNSAQQPGGTAAQCSPAQQTSSSLGSRPPPCAPLSPAASVTTTPCAAPSPAPTWSSTAWAPPRRPGTTSLRRWAGGGGGGKALPWLHRGVAALGPGGLGVDVLSLVGNTGCEGRPTHVRTAQRPPCRCTLSGPPAWRASSRRRAVWSA